MKRTLCFAAMAVMVCAAASAQTQFAGSWKLNLQKSNYVGTDAPKSRTTMFTNLKDGMFKHVAVGVSAQSEKSQTECTAKADGKDYAMTGSKTVNAMAIKTEGPGVSSWVTKLDGKEVSKGTSTLSADKKTMTVSYQGKAADGKPVSVTAVYDRQ